MHIPELLGFLAFVVGLALICGVYMGKLALAAALDIGMLLASLIWLFLLVKIPWDLYFAARKARLDGQEISDAARLEKRLVLLSHRFEEVVEKMSSDQELLGGIRAFVRLFREQPPAAD